MGYKSWNGPKILSPEAQRAFIFGLRLSSTFAILRFEPSGLKIMAVVPNRAFDKNLDILSYQASSGFQISPRAFQEIDPGLPRALSLCCTSPKLWATELKFSLDRIVQIMKSWTKLTFVTYRKIYFVRLKDRLCLNRPNKAFYFQVFLLPRLFTSKALSILWKFNHLQSLV